MVYPTELEKQVKEGNISKFLRSPERIPDSSTVLVFRERLIDTDKTRNMGIISNANYFKGLKVKEGVIEDATFIASDSNHKE